MVYYVTIADSHVSGASAFLAIGISEELQQLREEIFWLNAKLTQERELRSLIEDKHSIK
jgi:hypothetical protein